MMVDAVCGGVVIAKSLNGLIALMVTRCHHVAININRRRSSYIKSIAVAGNRAVLVQCE